jgi:hypothetical protein
MVIEILPQYPWRMSAASPMLAALDRYFEKYFER